MASGESMESEKIFYSIVAAIIIIGGVSIGAAYYGTVSSPHKTTPTSSTTTLDLIVVPSGWFTNGTLNQDQPAYLLVGPNGALQSTANINLPSHKLIKLTLVDYDGWGLTGVIGPNGTANVSSYAKVIGTVGGVEHVYNSTNVNVTLPSPTANNVSIPAGFSVTSFPWSGNASGGYDVAHTFTILNGSNIMVNIPSPGDSTVFASFYLNTTGTFTWQCFVPCGAEATGWGGAMITAGWMTGTIHVS